MQFDINALRAEEARCITKLQRRADTLQRESPGLARSIALGRAIEEFPVCASKYSRTRLILTMHRIGPMPFK
jgi:hypothetical protein